MKVIVESFNIDSEGIELEPAPVLEFDIPDKNLYFDINFDIELQQDEKSWVFVEIDTEGAVLYSHSLKVSIPLTQLEHTDELVLGIGEGEVFRLNYGEERVRIEILKILDALLSRIGEIYWSVRDLADRLGGLDESIHCDAHKHG